MVMDDPHDPIVRALRESPPPEPSYWPGRFSQRLRSGEPADGRLARRASDRRHRFFATARGLGVAGLVIVLVAAYLVFRSGPSSTIPGSSPSPSPTPQSSPSIVSTTTLRIGLSLPLSSDPGSDGNSIRDGALLAIKDANDSGPLLGRTIEPVILDHSTPGDNNLDKGIADMRSLVKDPTVLGVIGPVQSYVAQGQIPVANAAGLLQCSPSASDPGLTKGPQGQELRITNPDRVAFLRLGPTDDDVGPALADFTRQTLGAKSAFVIDDGADYGVPLADAFSARFQTGGGVVVGHQSTVPGTTDYGPVLRIAAGLRPDVVMYGGVNAFGGDAASGAGALRRQMAAAGLAKVPLVGGDGLRDLDRAGRSLIDVAGSAATGTYSADLAPADYAGEASFDAAFQAAYGRSPGRYAASGYACAEVILQSIESALGLGPITRENVRAGAADTGQTFTTVLGPIRFDSAGDEIAPIISIDAADPGANGGAGGWIDLHRGAPLPK